MNNQAKVVLWIGLILIVVQLAQSWQQIRAIIFKPGMLAGNMGGGLPSGIGGNPCAYCAGVPAPFNVPCWLECEAAHHITGAVRSTPPQHRTAVA